MAPALPALVSPELLRTTLEASTASVVVLDATTALAMHGDLEPYTAEPLRDAYLEGHVPGAGFVDVTHELSDTAAEQLFTLPAPEALAAAFGAVGVGDDTHVVVYDNVGNAWATRVWWLLRWLGHDAVSVLDGGLGAWRAAGLPVATGGEDDAALRATPRTLTPHVRPELLATTSQVAELSAGATPGVLVNALDPETFRGEQSVCPYPRRGRIPGSVNLPLFELLDPETGRLLPVASLRDRLQAGGVLGAERAVTYCGGGIAATVPAFAAFVVDGTEVAVYDGSLSEWTSDEARPVEVG
ncbi:Rhodanese domain protein [Cellulomonas flavigena DSM 20109]|uniref:Rhodanese domain protein n=1 Tax=Cellulomonas flavigena (strain ATCC 482 / DSM 20109 / BCRC 11376 / JCM 18109 / NBRC 3775 / NCIMB 8073 / NRS 134) TaxID=446466 RepID=D5UHU5_CELFN|nr:rhodanese-like domain-containing protein [Cellulomonas flavigena]ADG73369.1 Rhodanese domain protein [Cellulomonas flavigena DSM 20109]